jgi:cell wall-associated NlpC family hydrolase
LTTTRSINHSTDYQAQVLTIARSYAAQADTADTADTTDTAVAFARAQLGVPYVWGGNGPAQNGAFDCSGLTRAAYATAGIDIPRTADTQWRHGPPVPAGQPLQPGDLLFYGTPARATHVTLYVGGGQVIHAPQPGDHVRTAAMWNTGLLGVTRPAAHDLTAPHGANRCSYTPAATTLSLALRCARRTPRGDRADAARAAVCVEPQDPGRPCSDTCRCLRACRMAGTRSGQSQGLMELL